jgi:hypothetical protein
VYNWLPVLVPPIQPEFSSYFIAGESLCLQLYWQRKHGQSVIHVSAVLGVFFQLSYLEACLLHTAL